MIVKRLKITFKKTFLSQNAQEKSNFKTSKKTRLILKTKIFKYIFNYGNLDTVSVLINIEFCLIHSVFLDEGYETVN